MRSVFEFLSTQNHHEYIFDFLFYRISVKMDMMAKDGWML
jgi:hypothetical protein